AGDGQIGLDEERRSIGVERLVHRDRTARRETDALTADGLVLIAQPGDTEKHERPVALSYLPRLLGVGEHPFADPGHRHFFTGDDVAFDQRTADGRERQAVVGIVIDSQQQPILEPYPGRALDLY